MRRTSILNASPPFCCMMTAEFLFISCALGTDEISALIITESFVFSLDLSEQMKVLNVAWHACTQQDAGTMHFWCPVPVQVRRLVRTNTQTYRKTYRTWPWICSFNFLAHFRRPICTRTSTGTGHRIPLSREDLVLYAMLCIYHLHEFSDVELYTGICVHQFGPGESQERN